MLPSWKELSRMPAAELQNLQDRLLVRFLREDILPFHSYYGRIYREHGVDINGIRGAADLHKLPFTTKPDVIAATDKDPTAFVLKPTPEKIRAHWPLTRTGPLLAKKLLAGEKGARKAVEAEYLPIFMTATTGRTSRPVPFLYTKRDLRRLAESGKRLADLMGCSSEDRLLNMFPYAPHLAFWQVAFAGFEAGIFILSTGGGKTIGTVGNIRAIERIKPSGVLGVPSYLYHVLRTAAEEKVSLASIKLIVLGAEKVADGLRVKLVELAERCGAKNPVVMGTYGFTEAKMAWMECPGGSGYHLFPDLGVIEIVDPETGELKRDGETGEIVYTSIGGRGTVMVRYRTGDTAEGGITRDPCPNCGRTLPRLSSRITRISNRTDVRLTKVKGALIDLNHVASILSNTREVEEWQVVMKKRNDDPHDIDELMLYLAPASGAAIPVEEISKKIFDSTEVKPNAILIESLDQLIKRIGLETELKEKRFLDLR